MNLTASIVIYNTNKSQIEDVINSIEKSNCVTKLYMIDNSPSSENEQFFKDCSLSSIIEYIPHENTGYGSSHNIAMHKSIELGADYHVVLNPDIRFEADVLPRLCEYMNNNSDVVYILPKVIYPNGELQYLCKLLPTPSDLIFRRFLPKTEKKNDRYVLKESGYNKIMNPPCLSGCFMFLRNSALKENNIFFDDRFFMYFEDFDLIRRLHRVGKTIFYPDVSIIHDHAKESYKSKKMLMVHIKSAIKYFNKYGWFFDKERKEMNKQILKELGLGKWIEK
ncbi:MAG: glycosyltransferase family 2 protein [Treponema sp.]|nr:glycosyltransferase family 2 protein [Treponema sp.]